MAFMWNAKCFVSGYCHKSTVTWTLNMGIEALSRTAFHLDCVIFFWNKALNTSLRHTHDPFMTNKILGKTFDVVGYSRTVHTISLNQKLAIELFVDGLIFCLCNENGRVLFLQWPILNRIHVAALHWHVFMFGCHLPN